MPIKLLGGGYTNYFSFIANKAKRLLIPYFFVAIVWVVPISQYFYKWDAITLVKKYVLCTSPSQLWYLWMLFDLFVFGWQIKKILLTGKLKGTVLVVGIWAIGYLAEWYGVPNIFCILSMCKYLPFFYVGMNIRVKHEYGEKLAIEKLPISILFAVEIVIFALYLWLENNFSGIFISIIGLVQHIANAVIVVTILQILAVKVDWENNRLFTTLSRCSMPMYLFHQQIIYFFIRILNGKVSPYIQGGLTFIIAVICSLVISSVLMRSKYTRFLIGEK